MSGKVPKNQIYFNKITKKPKMAIKKTITKATAFFCIAGVVMINNVSLASAYEAHVMNVTANIIDNGITISPEGGKFCNDGKLKIEMSTKLSGAQIYYTLDGSEPNCNGNGSLYAEPFTLFTGKTVKAVSCYQGKQSLTATQAFDVSSNYCESSLKINKVYYNPDQAHTSGTCDNENEWVELYNPTKEAINLKNWSICNSKACDVLSSRDLTIASKGYTVITDKENTWNFWKVPSNIARISLNSAIGGGLNNTADMLFVKDSSGQIIDQMNWGTPDCKWTNYNPKVWNPAIVNAAEGKILGRNPNGYDTDQVSDWKAFSLPSVKMDFPNGGESWTVGKTYTMKWTARNNNGADSDLSIDLYYSADSGKTWANIMKNTENDGSYEWRLPLALKNDDGSNYFTPSAKSRIKVVATDYSRNFMLSAWDISDADFCPPIEEDLLTPEELELLKAIDTTGMEFVDGNGQIVNRTSISVSESSLPAGENNSGDSSGSEIKQNQMISKEEEAETESAPVENQHTDDNGDAVNPAEQENQTTAADSSVASADETANLPITPDGDTNVEFNLNF